MKNKYNVGVGVGVIVIRQGKILMQLRQGAHGSNTWAPPGGRLEHGENPDDTAVREVKEETDLDIDGAKYLTFTNDVFEEESLHYITLWYITNKSSGEPEIMEPEKCMKQRWMTLDEFPDNLFLTVINLKKKSEIINKINRLLDQSTPDEV